MDAVWWTLVVLAGVAAVIAGGFHVAWAFGVRYGTANVIPQRPDTDDATFRPQGPVTLVVAAALFSYAGLAVAVASGWGPEWFAWLLYAAVAILIARVIGEGRWVGLTKKVRDTGFARADDRYWTPAAALLALGAVAALILA